MTFPNESAGLLAVRESAYLTATSERVVIFDGATGSNLQMRDLGPDDFGGPALEGCNEILVATRPDVIRDLHDSFFAVGSDVVETNSFGSFSITLAEYDIADRAYELSRTSAELAREVAHGYSTPDRPRWVAGSMGPGTKFPSLGQIRFAALRDAFEVQARGLIDGGVDLILVETVFDLLQAKAAIIGARRAMKSAGVHLPLQVQVTMELTGRMLPGTEIAAAYTALSAMRPDVIGLNCATGPSEMHEHLRHLSAVSSVPISCLPNAGLPSVVDGKMHYDLTPAQLADYHRTFVTDLGVGVIGGCCGTTPEHLKAVIDGCAGLTPKARTPIADPGAASIYSHVPFQQDNSFLIIGERTNANGSKAFKEALLAADWDMCVKMAGEQVREGAHVLDVCVDYVGRDGALDMDEIASRFATQATAPLVLDSTEPPVLEAGLQWLGGKAILNSANLEEGEEPGTRFDRVMSLAAEYGAAVICLLIDEQGQARDLEWKMRVAHRIHTLATERYGVPASDLIFDALTFPLSTGDDDLRRDAMHTRDAIQRIKAEIPGCFTTLGLSNVSFGLKPAARHVLNSVYLHECMQVGLDSAIVHAAKIMPLSKIPAEQAEVCLDLIYDRRRPATATEPAYDPLVKLLDVFADVQSAKLVKEDRTDWPITERLAARIVDGERDGLVDDLDIAMADGWKPLALVNDVLLSGMKTVGELFGSGQMQLPFVLQSAETMKMAVRYLEPLMERVDGETSKGRLVLATVKGDVHDIGKNLVDIILTNNGYEVHNIGIKVAISEMIDKAIEVNADAIGMSGLLVKSTLIMRDNLEELNRRGLSHIPVMLGGAALTRTYVERDLRQIYDGRVFYGRDAFEGLGVMDRLGTMKQTGEVDDDYGRTIKARLIPEGTGRDPKPQREGPLGRTIADAPIFAPPFVGTKVIKGVSLGDISEYVNETALFRNQWMFRPEKGETDDEFKIRIRPIFREQLASAMGAGILIPQVVYGYFAANADGNDIIIWTDETRTAELARFSYPRQSDGEQLCIADFYRAYNAGNSDVDYAAFSIVTMGEAVSERAAELFAADRYQEYLLLHGLGVEMAEGLAELWHRRMREEWGYAGEDGPSIAGLFRQQYRGGRYSWGYPACPDLEDNAVVHRILDADRIGITVSEETSWQFQPEQTTSAIISPHPKAKYFVAR